MKEECVNVFAFGDKKFVHSLGHCSHFAEGDDEDLTCLLRSKVGTDYKQVDRIQLDPPIAWRDFNSNCRLGWLNELVGPPDIIPEGSIYCITPVVDGVVNIDEVVNFSIEPTFPDYLKVYLTETGFDLPRLINDDYLVAIKMLMNERKYVSALK